MAFDIEAARGVGKTDDEILNHLASSSGFNVEAARGVGKTDDEILNHLASSYKPVRRAMGPPSFEPESGPEPGPKGRGILAESATALTRGLLEVPAAAGYVMKALDYPGGLDVVRATGEALTSTFGALKESEFLKATAPDTRSAAGKAVLGVLESGPSSVAFGVPGAIIGEAVGPVGMLAGYATSGAILMGLAEKERAKEKAIKAGMSPEEAEKHAWIQGGYEASGEFLSDLVGGKILGLGGIVKATGKETIREILKPSFKEAAKRTALAMPAEIGGEMFTAAGQAAEERRVGLSTQSSWEAAKETIGTSGLMAIIFGIGVHGLNVKQGNDTIKALTDPNVDPEVRAEASIRIGESIREVDPELANYWHGISSDAVKSNRPIPIDNNIYEEFGKYLQQKDDEERNQADDFIQSEAEALRDDIMSAAENTLHTEAAKNVAEVVASQGVTEAIKREAMPTTPPVAPPGGGMSSADSYWQSRSDSQLRVQAGMNDGSQITQAAQEEVVRRKQQMPDAQLRQPAPTPPVEPAPVAAPAPAPAKAKVAGVLADLIEADEVHGNKFYKMKAGAKVAANKIFKETGVKLEPAQVPGLPNGALQWYLKKQETPTETGVSGRIAEPKAPYGVEETTGVAEPKAKYQMLPDEYLSQIFPEGVNLEHRKVYKELKARHKELVESAIKEGLDVPNEVKEAYGLEDVKPKGESFGNKPPDGKILATYTDKDGYTISVIGGAFNDEYTKGRRKGTFRITSPNNETKFAGYFIGLPEKEWGISNEQWLKMSWEERAAKEAQWQATNPNYKSLKNEFDRNKKEPGSEPVAKARYEMTPDEYIAQMFPEGVGVENVDIAERMRTQHKEFVNSAIKEGLAVPDNVKEAVAEPTPVGVKAEPKPKALSLRTLDAKSFQAKEMLAALGEKNKADNLMDFRRNMHEALGNELYVKYADQMTSIFNKVKGVGVKEDVSPYQSASTGEVEYKINTYEKIRNNKDLLGKLSKLYNGPIDNFEKGHFFHITPIQNIPKILEGGLKKDPEGIKKWQGEATGEGIYAWATYYPYGWENFVSDDLDIPMDDVAIVVFEGNIDNDNVLMDEDELSFIGDSDFSYEFIEGYLPNEDNQELQEEVANIQKNGGFKNQEEKIALIDKFKLKPMGGDFGQGGRGLPSRTIGPAPKIKAIYTYSNEDIDVAKVILLRDAINKVKGVKAPISPYHSEIREALLKYNPNYKPEDLDLAVDALGTTAEVIKGVRTRGVGIMPSLIKKGYMNINGLSGATSRGIATAAQVFRNPKYEVLRFVYTNEAGDIMGHEGMTAFLPGEVPFPDDLFSTRTKLRIERTMKRMGATKLWVVHNHPSGDPTASDDDLGASTKFSEQFGDKYAGHVIIDSNKYSHIITTKGVSDSEIKGIYTDESIMNASVPNLLLGYNITGSGSIASIAEILKSPEGFFTAMYRAGDGKLRAIQDVSLDKAKDAKGLLSFFRNRLKQFGASDVVVVVEGKNNLNKIANIMMTHVRAANILDFVVISNRGIDSYRNELTRRNIEPVQPEGYWMGAPTPKSVMGVATYVAPYEAQPNVFYHGTVEPRLDSILKNGLKKGTTIYGHDAVSLTTHENTIEALNLSGMWALGKATSKEYIPVFIPDVEYLQKNRPKIVVLEIKVPNNRLNELYDPKFEPGERSFKGDIPPSWITKVINEHELKELKKIPPAPYEAQLSDTGAFSALHDKRPRIEIDDSKAKIIVPGVVNPNNSVHKYFKGTKPLSEIYHHPELYRRYPELKDFSVTFVPGMKDNQQSDKGIEIGDIKMSELKKSLIHETQHWVQDWEGWAIGGSPEQFKRMPNKEFKSLIKKYPSLMVAAEAMDKGELSYEAYHRLAGEMEARDAAARVAMTPEQRAKIKPYSSENIPLKDLIIQYEGMLAKEVKEATAEGKEKRDKEWMSRTMDNIKSVFVNMAPLKDLPNQEMFLKERYKTLGKMHDIEATGRYIFKSLNTASEKTSKQIFEFLTTKDAKVSMIDDIKHREMANDIKGKIISIGQDLVDRGMLKKEIYEKNKGEYIPTVYLRYLLGEKAFRAFGTGRKLSSMGYLKHKKGLSPEVQKIFGRITDPAYLSAKAITVPLRDIAIFDWLTQISNNSDWVLPSSLVEWEFGGAKHKVTPYWLMKEAEKMKEYSDYLPEAEKVDVLKVANKMEATARPLIKNIEESITEDYKKVPESGRYGALRGLVVRREIYDDIVGSADIHAGDTSLAERILGNGGLVDQYTRFWKWAKVAANLPSQVRNFVSNGVFLHLSGVPFFKVPLRIGEAITEVRTNGKYWQIAKENGVTKATFTATEMARIEEEYLAIRKGGDGKFGWPQLVEFGAKVVNKTGDWYQFMEAISKTAKIIDEMKNGKSAEDAALEAHKWLFDYSLIPPSVRYLRNAPIGIPFLTFQYKAIPRLAEVAAKHPFRFLPYVAMMMALPMLVASMADVDDDDVDKLKKALPEWLQEKGHAFILPWKDEQGRWQAIDLGYFFPWVTVTELGGELAKGDIKNAVQTVGIAGGPVMSMVTAITTNKDAFTRKDIIDPLSTPSEQVGQLMMYLYRLNMPTWLTDMGAAGKLMDATSNKLDKYGEPKTTLSQAMARFAGVNIYGVEPERTRIENIKRKKYEIGQIEQRMRYQLKDKNLSPSDKGEIRNEYRIRIKGMNEELRTYIKESRIHPNLKTRGVEEE